MKMYSIPLVLALGAGACGLSSEKGTPKPENYRSKDTLVRLSSIGVESIMYDADGDGKVDVVRNPANGVCFYAPGFEQQCPKSQERHELSEAARLYANQTQGNTNLLDFELARIRHESKQSR